ncbi:MAG: acyl carrier protein [Clostridiales bacterium]|nr:acyl carrier protein [Clostridiales bacterium]
MSRDEIFEELNEIFQDVFDDEDITVSESTTADEIEDWDSLSHITLISAVEKKFKMRFKMNEVVNMANVGEMVDIIAERTM